LGGSAKIGAGGRGKGAKKSMEKGGLLQVDMGVTWGRSGQFNFPRSSFYQFPGGQKGESRSQERSPQMKKVLGFKGNLGGG